MQKATFKNLHIEKIPVKLKCSFFQKLAVTTKNEVFQWGSHPHGLRHFVHSQRRARQSGRPAFEPAERHLRPQKVDTTFVHGRIKQVETD